MYNISDAGCRTRTDTLWVEARYATVDINPARTPAPGLEWARTRATGLTGRRDCRYTKQDWTPQPVSIRRISLCRRAWRVPDSNRLCRLEGPESYPLDERAKAIAEVGLEPTSRGPEPRHLPLVRLSSGAGRS